jgi:hypothetical protein
MAEKAESLMRDKGIPGYCYPYWDSAHGMPDRLHVYFSVHRQGRPSLRSFTEPVEWSEVESHIQGEADRCS